MGIDKTAYIHPNAVVSEKAEIGARVRIDAFSVIGDAVHLGDDVHVKSHAIIGGNTEIGAGTVIFPFACLGEAPENKRSPGHNTRLLIGVRNQIREGVTINRGTEDGGGMTRIGDNCLFMAKSHIGHDCHIGNEVIIAPQAAIAGHCSVEDEVTISGLSGIHQFTRLGRGCFIGGMCKVARDVIPYALVDGAQGELLGVNINGLKRKGFSRKDITTLIDAFEILADDDGTFVSRMQKLYDETDNNYVKEIGRFILENEHKRRFIVPKKRKRL